MPRHLSHSALETFDQCPCQFKFKYIDRIDAKVGVIAETYLGQAAHSALKELYEARQFDKQLPLERVVNTYRQVWQNIKPQEVRVGKEYMTVQDYIELGEKWLKEYYQKNAPFDQSRVLSVERRHSAGLPQTELTLKGTIDLLLQRPDGSFEIVDFKTGREMPPNPRDNAFRKQMGLYLHLIKENYTELGNDGTIWLTQYYLRHGLKLSYQMPLEELDELLEEVRQLALEISYAEKHESYPPKESERCAWCDFQEYCPAKRHQFALRQEAGEEGKEEQSTYQTASGLADQYLELDAQIKDLKAKHDAIKELIVKTAQELQLQRMFGKLGSVAVSRKHETKFPTKSNGPAEFAKLSSLLWDWKYETLFELNATELAKLYKAARFSPEQLEKLQSYAIEQESIRVTTRKPQDDDND